MVTLSASAAVLAGVVMALWLGGSAWAMATGLKLRRRALFSSDQANRLATLLESSPAVPLIVRNDGRVEAQERLVTWLGLQRLPNFLSDLSLGELGLSADDMQALIKDVAAVQRTARTFTRTVVPRGGSRTLMIRGLPTGGRLAGQNAVTLWFFDMTESQAEIGRLSDETEQMARAFSTLTGLLEAAPFPMWHRGSDLRLAMVNTAYVRAVEAESAADVIERGLELIDADGGPTPMAAAAAARSKGEPTARVVPATINGERRALRIVDVPLGDSGIAGYAIDVEEVERARQAFRRFAETQRDTLDRLSAAVAQFADDRGLVFCNQPFQQMFGLKPEWVAERPDFDRLLDRMREANRLPETRDFPAWKAERRQWFNSVSGAVEENWILPGGQHFRLVGQPLPDGGLLIILEDRTEQAQLASARDTLLRVRTATLDNLFEAIGVFESNGRLSTWNNRFREVWEFEESFLVGHPRVDALAEVAASRLLNPERASLIRELVRSATVDRKQRGGRVALKSGRYFEFAAVPLPDGNALFTMLDITDSRQVENVLRERAAALEESDRIKTGFVANMSYELRTPLTSIQGFAEMLQSGMAGKISPQAAEYLVAILDSAARLGTLIDNVLDLTQSDAGALPIERKRIELAPLLREAAAARASAAGEKSIDLAVEIDASVGTIKGDRKRILQAVDQLLLNAISYTENSGRVLLHGSGTTDAATIIVSDNGPGMDDTEQARALDRFSRVGAGVGRDGDGSLGIGLPLARQFVEGHGGTLSLLSEVGEGTVVTIELPRG